MNSSEYVRRFLYSLKLLLNKLEKLAEDQFPKDYNELLIRVSPKHLKKIFRWIIENSAAFEISLSPKNPIRIAAFQKDYIFSDYPLPITIHLIMDRFGTVRLLFTPNSKQASISSNIIKDPEVKPGEKPKKRRGEGGLKIVNDAFCLENGKIKPFVATIMTGEKALLEFEALRNFYQNHSLPFILAVYYGAKYKGHSYKDYGKDKAITFSPRGDADLYDVISDLAIFQPTLFNILDIINKLTAGVKKLHDIGKIHRDIKPENLIVFHDVKNGMLNPAVHDLGGLIDVKNVKYSKLAGTVLYLPWDSPVFNKLLALHNQAIQEIKDFANNLYHHQTYLKKEIYDRGVKNRLDDGQLIKFYLNSVYGQEIMEFINKLPASAEVLELVKKEEIEIILTKVGSIQIYACQDFKDDIYGLCKTFKYLIKNFCEYKKYRVKPLILVKIKFLLNQNIHAPREKRINANDLLKCLCSLFQQMVNNPMKFLGAEENKDILIKRFLAEYHSVLKIINYPYLTLIPPTPAPVRQMYVNNNIFIMQKKPALNFKVNSKIHDREHREKKSIDFSCVLS